MQRILFGRAGITKDDREGRGNDEADGWPRVRAASLRLLGEAGLNDREQLVRTGDGPSESPDLERRRFDKGAW